MMNFPIMLQVNAEYISYFSLVHMCIPRHHNEPRHVRRNLKIKIIFLCSFRLGQYIIKVRKSSDMFLEFQYLVNFKFISLHLKPFSKVDNAEVRSGFRVFYQNEKKSK